MDDWELAFAEKSRRRERKALWQARLKAAMAAASVLLAVSALTMLAR